MISEVVIMFRITIQHAFSLLSLSVAHTHLYSQTYNFFLDGGRQVQNIQPFTKRDLEIRSLGDRIRDISEITFLYPNYPKHDVFKKHYSGEVLHNVLPQSQLSVFQFKIKFYFLSFSGLKQGLSSQFLQATSPCLFRLKLACKEFDF